LGSCERAIQPRTRRAPSPSLRRRREATAAQSRTIRDIGIDDFSDWTVPVGSGAGGIVAKPLIEGPLSLERGAVAGAVRPFVGSKRLRSAAPARGVA
jgi:hypothetical protein